MAYNSQKAAQVWQRVLQQTPQQATGLDPQQLPQMIADELTDAAIYLALSRRYQGKENALLRQMFQQEQDHAACLRGMYTLITGTRPAVRSQKPTQEKAEELLRRCYGREMRALVTYEEKSSDPVYGQIFAQLAQQERAHCHNLLTLLGKFIAT